MAQPVKAKKHLGQHFLCDEKVAQRIVNSLPEEAEKWPLVEIGPGSGVLTKYFIEQKKDFFALDIDRESVDYLHEQYSNKKDHVLLLDFLDADLAKMLGKKFSVIGNFPYNISSQIMFRVLELRQHIPCVVGMFQKEVAQRIAEKPGTKTYGILSVLLQAYYKIEYLFTVHENVFSPPPKVKSAVIRLTRNEVEQLECDETLFFRVVKATFNQRRKQIRNSIRSVAEIKSNHALMEKRPEQLSVKDFVELTNICSEIIRRG